MSIQFCHYYSNLIFFFQNQYLERLKAIRKALNTSLFFKTHEVRIL